MNHSQRTKNTLERSHSFKHFEDITAWQKARSLTKAIYALTEKNNSFCRDFDLVRQARRCAVSTMSNIAEGFERDGNREFVNFLSIAKGSCGELRSHLYTALDQDYVSRDEFEQLRNQATEVSRVITGLMTYLRRSKVKGMKFKESS